MYVYLSGSMRLSLSVHDGLSLITVAAENRAHEPECAAGNAIIYTFTKNLARR